jgi:single-strand DNA-binding protein
MNLVEITGNLTKDVETRATQSGKSVATLSVAVKRPYSEETDFFNAIVWDKKAENCAKFLKKGSKVGISGYLYNRSYEDRDGNKRTITEINATEVEFLSPKTEESEPVEEKPKHKLTPIIDENQLPF